MLRNGLSFKNTSPAKVGENLGSHPENPAAMVAGRVFGLRACRCFKEICSNKYMQCNFICMYIDLSAGQNPGGRGIIPTKVSWF